MVVDKADYSIAINYQACQIADRLSKLPPESHPPGPFRQVKDVNLVRRSITQTGDRFMGKV
jgi:hypothetical protein